MPTIHEKKNGYSRNRAPTNPAFKGLFRLAGCQCQLNGKMLEGGKSIYFKKSGERVGLISYRGVLYDATLNEKENVYILSPKSTDNGTTSLTQDNAKD